MARPTTDDRFRASRVVDIGRIDEIDALIERFIDDAFGRGFVCLFAEHHRAQAERRYFQGAATQIAVIHAGSPFTRRLLQRYAE
jgi:hypothetical protein